MKFSELSEKDKITKIKEEFHEIVIRVMNNSTRIRGEYKQNEEVERTLLTFLETVGKDNVSKENPNACYCTDCVDYNKYVQIPLDPALEPLVEVARNVAMTKEY